MNKELIIQALQKIIDELKADDCISSKHLAKNYEELVVMQCQSTQALMMGKSAKSLKPELWPQYASKNIRSVENNNTSAAPITLNPARERAILAFEGKILKKKIVRKKKVTRKKVKRRSKKCG